MAGAKLNPLLQKVALVRDDDFYMGLDDIAFRTCVQEKAHHSLEIQVCHAEHTGCEMFPQRPALVEHINKVLDAGLWAAHACNLQSIRYLVVRE